MADLTVARLAVSAATYPIDRPYDYKIPEKFRKLAAPGVRVLVPFGRGNRKSEGVILSLAESSEHKGLKSIETVIDAEAVLTENSIRLALWMSDRFFCTVFDAFRVMLPAGMWHKDGKTRSNDKVINVVTLKVTSDDAKAAALSRKKRAPMQSAVLELLAMNLSMTQKELCLFTGASSATMKALVKQDLVNVEEHVIFRRPAVTLRNAEPITLNKAQMAAFDGLKEMTAIDAAGAAVLYGVTGSGKTSVYIKLIEEVLARGKNAIVLVPEIALTPQVMSIFSSYFGDKVAVLHSALGVGERYDEWKRIRTGSVGVVVGTRSAVFAPLENLGLIILDEEQEYTYKSESSPRYHARDIAKYRCVKSNALLLLGSATPSIESMYSVQSRKYKLFRIENRYNEKELPPVIIADMKIELKNGNGGLISSILKTELVKNFESGQQSILFINRRGTNPLVTCGECGYMYMCPRCSVSMTYHRNGGRMLCHYCGYSIKKPENCSECGGMLKYVGAGTQKAEAELLDLFPGIGIIRMDADALSASNSHDKLLSRFRDEKTPILIGTQMVTKGLDFENVTLVGVLSADLSLYINDYRANERTFSLITQVIGRSGRGDKPGRAVIQTFTPEHDVISLSANQDYKGFYRREIKMRRILGSPPVRDLIMLTVTGIDETSVLASCARLRSTLEGYFRGSEIKLMGPAPAPVSKVNNRFRYRILISCENNKSVRDTVAHTIREFSRDKRGRGVTVYADADPYD